MFATLYSPPRFALRAAGATLAAIAVLGCSDAAAPLAPALEGGPSHAANIAGGLAVRSLVGLEPLMGASENRSNAYDINDLGQVVGSSGATGVGSQHAVLWEAGSTFPLDLGTLGGAESAAFAIDGSGTTIVGWAQTADAQPHATRWVKLGGAWVALDLGALDGALWSEAHDIADNGAIVGLSVEGNFVPHGVLWQNGKMTDLRPAGFELAEAVNLLGQVAGRSSSDLAVLWTLAGGTTQLGTLGGSFSHAFAINASGEVAGVAENSSGEDRAFLWTIKKGMIDLGTLGGPSSRARGINDAAQVVGFSDTEAGMDRAFIWAKGKMLELPPLAGYEAGVSRAAAINNKGQVVGESDAGTVRATLWTVK